MQATRTGDYLIVVDDNLKKRVDVDAPANLGAGDAVISAMVTIKMRLPSQFSALAGKPGFVAMINRMATLGAVTAPSKDCS